MPLPIGSRLGPYDVTALVGAGGMGEVYRARDTALNRDVALKVLFGSVAHDPDRLARFRREAQVLAALNHPNIAHIHGLETSGDTLALVMELVEGEDLSVKISRGALPLDEVLAIARQIAEALEAAHDQGIIHRDLKPANVKVRADGVVKVLDFGLAKALSPEGTSVSPEHSPTLTARATQLGMILGTAAYMAPEQAKGKPVDRRADIWAFGAVVFEMLTGRRAFTGEDVSETLASVLRQNVEWSALPAATPPRLRRLLERCLDRDARARLRDIGEARVELAKIEAGAPDTSSVSIPVAHSTSAPPRGSQLVPWSIVAVLGAGLIGTLAAWAPWRAAPIGEQVQFTIAPPDKGNFAGPMSANPQIALSADGRFLVFVATASGRSTLWIRSLADLTLRELPGTEFAAFPFWSPDGKHIAFVASGKLKRTPVSGGAPVALADVAAPRGGAWSKDNVIVFAPGSQGGLLRVSANGGAATPATVLDEGPTSHRWPSFLPDGQHFLFWSNGPVAQVRIGRLGSTDSTELIQSDTGAQYGSGHLVFGRGGTLVAQPFDPDAKTLSGDTVQISARIGSESTAHSPFAVSGSVLVLNEGGRFVSRLTWFDRRGAAVGTVGEPGIYYNLALSRDERRVAVSMSTGSPENRDIHIIDTARGGITSRFTFDPAADVIPGWSGDGQGVVFGSLRPPRPGVYIKSAGGGSQETLLFTTQATPYPMDWSRDGKFLVYTDAVEGGAGLDVLVRSMADGTVTPFLATPFAEDYGAFSPDGRWIAYTSNESGREEVYVRPFPATGNQFRVSRDGGSQPAWRNDGRELVFMKLDSTLMAATVDTSRGFDHSIPQPLFRSNIVLSANRHQYGLSKDGKRILAIVPEEQGSLIPLVVRLNWATGIGR